MTLTTVLLIAAVTGTVLHVIATSVLVVLLGQSRQSIIDIERNQRNRSDAKKLSGCRCGAIKYNATGKIWTMQK